MKYKMVEKLTLRKTTEFSRMISSAGPTMLCSSLPIGTQQQAGSVRQTGRRQGQQDECLRRFSLQVITSPAGGLEL